MIVTINHDLTDQDLTRVHKTTTVDVGQQRAFDVWVHRFDSWWSRSHHIGQVDMAEAVLEPKVGGRWYEKGVDGSECEWGKVLVYEPPRRIVLAWQINGSWQYDPDLVTELEVRFLSVDAGRTRVELEHRNLDRFGESAASIRTALDSPGGWNGLLAGYAAATKV